jgi:hypothetical protein
MRSHRYDAFTLGERVLSTDAQPHTPRAGTQPSKVTRAGETCLRKCAVTDKYYGFIPSRLHNMPSRCERWKQLYVTVPRPKFHETRKVPWNQK